MTNHTNEIKIRTQWLVLLILSTVINLSDPHNIITLKSSETCTSWVRTLAFLVNTTITLLTSFIVYFCAYRKPGTKILTFTLFSVPIKYLICAFFIFKFKKEFHGNYSVIALQIIPIWSYILDWKMRILNKIRQKTTTKIPNC